MKCFEYSVSIVSADAETEKEVNQRLQEEGERIGESLYNECGKRKRYL